MKKLVLSLLFLASCGDAQVAPSQSDASAIDAGVDAGFHRGRLPQPGDLCEPLPGGGDQTSCTTNPNLALFCNNHHWLATECPNGCGAVDAGMGCL